MAAAALLAAEDIANSIVSPLQHGIALLLEIQTRKRKKASF
jgi:hypothetical protein